QQSFRPLISMGVRSHLPVAIKSNHMDIFEIDEHLEELSEGVRQRLLVGFEEYGLTIPQFYISHVELPDPKKDLNFGRMVELHTLSLQSRMIQADKSIRIEQSDADTSVKVAQAENDAIVRQALRKREEERQITMTEMEKHKSQRELIQAQTEAQKTLIRANAAAVAKQEIGLAEAKVMEAKGYDQKDVFQKDVQIEQAKSIGNMTINGSGGGMASEMMSMVAGMAAANAFVPQFSNMFSGMMPAQAGIPVTPAPMTSAPAVSASEAPETGEKCAKCGASLPENAKFCLECGEKVAPKIPDGMIICPKCGATVTKSKFCMECGYKFVTVCPSCGKNVADGAKFCMECGTKL
ncbi:MAG: zinc-ribbon domain-containing protein, partial [Clostridia bacterium]|nr:zinc-ribbon domain-containing protein [Clostridia bacterium]